MVRSRTPKITLHTEESKCILYDTSPDFEACFYQGSKFHISKEGTIKITHPDGTSISLESNSTSTCLSPEMQDMLEKAHKWHKYSLEEELIREKRKEIYRDIISFPLTIGRKPQLIKQHSLPAALHSTSSHMSSSQPNLPMVAAHMSSASLTSEKKYAPMSNAAATDDYADYLNKNMNALDLKSASTTSLASSTANLYHLQAYANNHNNETTSAKTPKHYDSSTAPSPMPMLQPLAVHNDLNTYAQHHPYSTSSNFGAATMSAASNSYRLNTTSTSSTSSSPYPPQIDYRNHQNQYMPPPPLPQSTQLPMSNSGYQLNQHQLQAAAIAQQQQYKRQLSNC